MLGEVLSRKYNGNNQVSSAQRAQPLQSSWILNAAVPHQEVSENRVSAPMALKIIHPLYPFVSFVLQKHHL